MRGPIYRYNPQTCRYERTTVSAGAAFSYMLGLSFSALLILAGLIFLYDKFITSDKEVALRKENLAIEKHEAILTNQVLEIESKLEALKSKDAELYGLLFTDNSTKTSDRSDSKESLLTADVAQSGDAIRILSENSDKVRTRAQQFNFEASKKLDIKKHFNILRSIPIQRPLRAVTPQMVISGFGMRTNPFHKGLYMHHGVDITAPRGTEVLATADGTVLTVRKSDLEAGIGNAIEIDHGNGFVTRYNHLDEISVKKGQLLKQGAIVGKSGNSGGSVAPHLHYEIVRNGKPVDPIDYMISGFTDVEYMQFKSATDNENQSLD